MRTGNFNCRQTGILIVADHMGTAAIVIAPNQSLTGSNNKCENNDVSSFKASLAEISLEKDSKNNIVVGSKGRAKDLGVDNKIKGLTRVKD